MFRQQVARSEAGGENGKLAVNLSSKERLELNVTATFIELAITSYTNWTKESDRILKNARGGDAPYLVRNRTGYPIDIWADKRGGRVTEPKMAIADGDEVPWRFEDYKTLREVSRRIICASLSRYAQVMNSFLLIPFLAHWRGKPSCPQSRDPQRRLGTDQAHLGRPRGRV